tara:strand:+ start:2390 stop:3091 length:702 start_codon:yes stop_codon:yes gene_type:complete
MKTFKQYQYDSNILTYDDWGPDSDNNNAITEAGLARIIQKVKVDQEDFIIITAYRGEFDKKENIARNRDLRGWFNRQEMGVYQLVGHWRECSIENVPYDQCPANKLVDVVERSYLAVRPDTMSTKEFFSKCKFLTKKWKQDGSVIRIQELFGDEIQILEKSGNTFGIGSGISLGKISQAYSQHVKKLNTPFVFEGVEVPSTNFGKQIAEKYSFNYPVGIWDDLKSWESIVTNI